MTTLTATVNDWAWVAGLLEGEGTMGVYDIHKAKGTTKRVSLACNMCDEDIVKRLPILTGVGKVHYLPWSAKEPNKKPQWRWAVHKRADVRSVLQGVMPWLGKRRAAKATEVLDFIEISLAKRGW